MNRKLNQVVLCCLLTLGSLSRAQQLPTGPSEDSGVIRQVTLYRDRALVTREIAVPPGDQLRSVEVPDLPELVIPDSVYADGDAGTIVRAVRVSTRPVAESLREEVQVLDQQISQLNRQRAETQQILEVTNRNIALLDQLVNFSAAAGNSDLNRGVLNAETLTALTTFSMTQRRELASEQLRYQQQLEGVDRQLQLAMWKRDQATTGQQAANYRAKIFVEIAQEAAGTVRLSYLVGGCGWSPQYTVRGQIGAPTFELQYSALVEQMSGEDWNDVSLILSTASPSVSAARPQLTPLRVTSVGPSGDDDNVGLAKRGADPFGGSAPGDQADVLSGMIESLRMQQRNAETDFDSGPSADYPAERDLVLNSLAGRMQQIELQAESKSWRTLAPDVNDDVASQTYMLSQPVSLDTRREQQLVQILAVQLAGEMYHVATPLLSTYAYREAEMTNDQPVGLLGGPATIYLDDRFVGRTQIPSTASGQRLTIGFGADQQVRTRRELLDKQDEVQGGNRRLKFVYRLVLSNFKDRPVAVRLTDRMPITRQTQQLSVRLDDPQPSLSADGLYQRILRPTGILRWDLTVPEARHGSKAFDVQYSYTMEFDRSRIPTTQHMLDEMQADYRDMNLPAGMGGMGGMGGNPGGPGGSR